jgi:hypothetical protein
MNAVKPMLFRSILCCTLFSAGCGSDRVEPLSEAPQDPNGELTRLRPVIGSKSVIDEPNGATSNSGKHKLEIAPE